MTTWKTNKKKIVKLTKKKKTSCKVKGLKKGTKVKSKENESDGRAEKENCHKRKEEKGKIYLFFICQSAGVSFKERYR